MIKEIAYRLYDVLDTLILAVIGIPLALYLIVMVVGMFLGCGNLLPKDKIE